MQKYGVATPPGAVAGTPEEAEAIALSLKTSDLVIKADPRRRSRRDLPERFKGEGIHLCKTPKEIKDFASKMIGQTLVTVQTGEEGKLVSKVLVGQSKDIARELYFAIVLDREAQAPVVIASTKGGVNIEEVAEHTPELILRMRVDPALGLQPCGRKPGRMPLISRNDLAARLRRHLHALYLFLEPVITGGNQSSCRLKAKSWRSMPSSTSTTTRCSAIRRSWPIAM